MAPPCMSENENSIKSNGLLLAGDTKLEGNVLEKKKIRMPNFYNKRQTPIYPGKAAGLTEESNKKESKKIIKLSLSGAKLINCISQL